MKKQVVALVVGFGITMLWYKQNQDERKSNCTNNHEKKVNETIPNVEVDELASLLVVEDE